MANFSTNEFKPGMKVMLDGEPCSIMENEYVLPGKGQAKAGQMGLRDCHCGRIDGGSPARVAAEATYLVPRELVVAASGALPVSRAHAHRRGTSPCRNTRRGPTSLAPDPVASHRRRRSATPRAP